MLRFAHACSGRGIRPRQRRGDSRGGEKKDATPPQNEAHGTLSKGGSHSEVTRQKERWNYEITVENKTFHPMTAVEVRYMIFYKTEELGSKTPPQQQHESGSYSIDSLAPHEKKIFNTNAVELRKSHLTGYWYYSGGGRIKAEDTLAGVCVRVSINRQQVGEYANPSSLMNEQWQ